MEDPKEFTYMEGTLIGAQLVVNDDLWYVERISKEETHGYLNRLNLIDGTTRRFENLPMIGTIFIHEGDILAIARNYLISIRNGQEIHSCSLFEYDMGSINLKFSGIKITTSEKFCPQEEQSWMRSKKLPIGGRFLENDSFWFGAGTIINPSGHSRDFSKIGGGLHQYDLKTGECQCMLDQKSGLGEDTITCINKFRDQLLLGTNDGNLHFFDLEKGIVNTLDEREGMFNSWVKYIHVFKKQILIATSLGYIIYDHKKDKAIKYDYIYQDQYFEQIFDKSTLSWKKDEKILEYNPPYHALNAILELKKTTLYGTLLGLYVHDKKRDKWVHYQEENGAPDNRVYSFSQWKDHVIMGTDKGLYKYKLY